MSICLNMIVRNEAHNIPRLFQSLKGIIKSYVILDTGSQDGTIEKIQEQADDIVIPGMVVQTGWTSNFGEMRQKALDLALDYSLEDHILIMDGDEEMICPHPEQFRTLNPKVSYRVPKHVANLRNDHINLLSAYQKGNWLWKGKLHEFLQCPPDHEIEKIHGAKIIAHLDEGGRTGTGTVKSKLLKDQIVLEGMLEDPSMRCRAMFYLAQTHKALGFYSTARDLYTELLNKESIEDPQMEYRALIEVFRCSQKEKTLKTSEASKMLTRAFEFRTHRAEALYYLTTLYKKRSRLELAWIYASAGVERLHVIDNYMIEADIYEWRMLCEYCELGLRLGKRAKVLDLLETVLEDLNPTHRTLEFVLKKKNLLDLRYK